MQIAPEMDQSPKRALTFIFMVLLLDVMGLTLLFPVQAFIVRRYSSDTLMIALIPGLYAGAPFLATPTLGRLSDRLVGRRSGGAGRRARPPSVSADAQALTDQAMAPTPSFRSRCRRGS